VNDNNNYLNSIYESIWRIENTVLLLFNDCDFGHVFSCTPCNDVVSCKYIVWFGFDWIELKIWIGSRNKCLRIGPVLKPCPIISLQDHGLNLSLTLHIQLLYINSGPRQHP